MLWGINWPNLLMLYKEIPGEVEGTVVKKVVKTKEDELRTLRKYTNGGRN